MISTATFAVVSGGKMKATVAPQTLLFHPATPSCLLTLAPQGGIVWDIATVSVPAKGATTVWQPSIPCVIRQTTNQYEGFRRVYASKVMTVIQFHSTF